MSARTILAGLYPDPLADRVPSAKDIPDKVG